MKRYNYPDEVLWAEMRKPFDQERFARSYVQVTKGAMIGLYKAIAGELLIAGIIFVAYLFWTRV